MVREEGAGVGWGWGAEEKGEKGRDRETEGKRKRLANWEEEAAIAATCGRSEALQLVSGAATPHTGPANRGEGVPRREQPWGIS